MQNSIFSNFMNIILSLLVIGVSFMLLYVYRRLNLLENSIIEHGKILHNFIQNYNMQVCNIQNNLVNNKLQSENINNNNQKIEKISEEVYEEENDEYEEDSEEYSEEEGEEDSEEDSEENLEEVVENLKTEKINISDDEINESELNNISENISMLDLKEEKNNFNGMIDLDISKIIIDSSIFDDDNLENNDNFNSKSIVINNDFIVNDKSKKKETNIKKMKIDDLRNLVIEKKILDNEEANKLKKQELIYLLNNQ